MIALIDYGMGNLASVRHALAYLGAEAETISEGRSPAAYEAVILPGVGAWDEAVLRLRASGCASMIKEAAAAGLPFLGICLGLQLLFQSSEEGREEGLGLVPGEVRHLPVRAGLTLPHMGWNSLQQVTDPLLREGSFMYFVHCYHAVPADPSVISAQSEHGVLFTAAIKYKNITAFQFHPERSGDAGLALLGRWLEERKK